MTLAASVIIATCRRPQLLAQCLERLKPGAQSLSGQYYEVIVADDDPARSATALLTEKYPWVRHTHGPSLGPAAARNAAAALAQSPLLVFTDDDCVPAMGLVEAYLRCHAPLMYGPTTCQAGCHSPFLTAPVNPLGAHTFGCNLACHTQLFRQLGGFDEKFLFYGFEDYDFFARAHQAGHPAQLVRAARVDHPPRTLATAYQRTKTLQNLFRYQLKHGVEPSLTFVLKEILINWRNRLRLPVGLYTRLRAAGSMICELLLALALYEELLETARHRLKF